MQTLLNIDANAKTIKGVEQGFQTGIMYLMPADASGYNMCPTAVLAGCDILCLNTAGRGGMSKANKTFRTPGGVELPDNTVQRARLARTLGFHNNRALFLDSLVYEIVKARRKAHRAGLVPVFRLNGTSDIRWEDIPVMCYANIFAAFPDVQFYDYTKIPNRHRALKIPNYHLTFSYSHRALFAPIVVKALEVYGEQVNFAVVFKGPMPETFLGRRVVNGDETDLRFLDETGIVVGLSAKGRAKKDKLDFVVTT